MMNLAMLYLGAALITVWGIIHLLPTGSIVKGFGDISADNKRILTMGWIGEGVALVLVGVIVASVTFIDPASAVSKAVFVVSAIGLFVLAAVSFLTGFKVSQLPFKICPVIRLVSGLLVLVGGFL